MNSEIMENKVLKIDKTNWELTKLGDLLVDISQRVDHPSKSGYDRFVGLEHFVSGDIKIKNWGPTKNLTSSTKAFQAGDILFARRNAYLRRASLVDFDGCCSGDAFVLRENHDKVVPGFLAFFMNSNAVWNFANENAAGTMSKRVKWRDLANYEFLLPPKDQQAELAELLWAMDEVIEREKEVLVKLRSLRNSILEQQVYKLRTTNSSRIKLAKLITLKHGFPFKSEFWANDDNRLPIVVTIGNYDYDGGFRFESTKIKCYSGKYPKEYILKPGDLMLAMTCQTPGGEILGIPGFIENDGRKYLHNQRIGKVELENEQLVLRNYLFLIFLTRQFRQFVFSSASGTKVLHTSPAKILKYEFDLPDLAYQKQIYKEFESTLDAELLGRAKVDSNKSIQKSLINQIF